jgi:hypothetical protein
MLDAVLAEVHPQAVQVVRPRAAGAVEPAVGVVHPQQRVCAGHRPAAAREHADDALGGAPARRGVAVLDVLRVGPRHGPNGMDPSPAADPVVGRAGFGHLTG